MYYAVPHMTVISKRNNYLVTIQDTFCNHRILNGRNFFEKILHSDVINLFFTENTILLCKQFLSLSVTQEKEFHFKEKQNWI